MPSARLEWLEKLFILSEALAGEHKEQTKERNALNDQHENGKKYIWNYLPTINLSLPICHALRQANQICIRGN